MRTGRQERHKLASTGCAFFSSGDDAPGDLHLHLLACLKSAGIAGLYWSMIIFFSAIATVHLASDPAYM